MGLYKTKAAVQNWKKGETVELGDDEAARYGSVFLEKLDDKQVKKASVKDVDPAEEDSEEEAPKKKKKK